MSTAQFMIDRIVSACLAEREEIVGCTEEEVRAVEIIHQATLPESYREFLLAMGRGMGRMFNPWEGYGVLFDQVKYLTWEIRFQETLFAADYIVAAPPSAFFIGTFQSCDYWYLDLAADPHDPPVWGWGDSWAEDDQGAGTQLLFPSVWDWLETEWETRMAYRYSHARAAAGRFDGEAAAEDIEAIHDLLLRGLRQRWERYQQRANEGPIEECPF